MAQDYHLGKDKDTGLLVRGGLYEAHLRHRRLDTCYWPEPSHRLLRGTWFLEKAPDWVPLKVNLSWKLIRIPAELNSEEKPYYKAIAKGCMNLCQPVKPRLAVPLWEWHRTKLPKKVLQSFKCFQQKLSDNLQVSPCMLKSHSYCAPKELHCYASLKCEHCSTFHQNAIRLQHKSLFPSRIYIALSMRQELHLTAQATSKYWNMHECFQSRKQPLMS